MELTQIFIISFALVCSTLCAEDYRVLSKGQEVNRLNFPSMTFLFLSKFSTKPPVSKPFLQSRFMNLASTSIAKSRIFFSSFPDGRFPLLRRTEFPISSPFRKYTSSPSIKRTTTPAPIKKFTHIRFTLRKFTLPYSTRKFIPPTVAKRFTFPPLRWSTSSPSFKRFTIYPPVVRNPQRSNQTALIVILVVAFVTAVVVYAIAKAFCEGICCQNTPPSQPNNVAGYQTSRRNNEIQEPIISGGLDNRSFETFPESYNPPYSSGYIDVPPSYFDSIPKDVPGMASTNIPSSRIQGSAQKFPDSPPPSYDSLMR